MNENIDNSFAKSIIELKLQVDKIIESQNLGAFTMKYKILYLVMAYDKTSPQQLILGLNVAKSNLALIAKKMIREGLIDQVKDDNNKKQIYYIILEKGKKELLAKMNDINNVEIKQEELFESLTKVNQAMQKK